MRPSTIRVALAAILAATALSAVGASAAQAAEEHTFKSATSPTNYTAIPESEHVFTIAGGAFALACKSTLLEGTEVGKERDEMTLVPTIDGCSAGGLGEAVVTEHHCGYVFDSDTTTHGGEAEHAPMDIECSGAEGKITIALPNAGITITIGPQTDLHGVQYENTIDQETGRTAITLDTTVEGIAWNCSPAFLCSLGLGASSGTDGTYDGSLILTGYEDEGTEQTGTAKTTTTLDHGDQVDVTMTTP